MQRYENGTKEEIEQLRLRGAEKEKNEIISPNKILFRKVMELYQLHDSANPVKKTQR